MHIYLPVSGTITFTELAAGRENDNMQIVFNNCAPFTDCISELNNTQTDNAKDVNIVMPMYNLIEYSDDYVKITGRLCLYYRDEPALTNNGTLGNFPANSALFKFKQKVTGSTGDDGTKKC